MSLTNFLLLLILSILTTYTFMTWKGIDKGSKINILIQFILWTIAFGLISFVLIKFNLVN
ncbi:hypothetical protein N9V55_02465 [Candidatus Pelagibacter bacterium]|jgi:hypothetical protein|nr:hypothetical protein [Candidatus Pelagibacter bacterium]